MTSQVRPTQTGAAVPPSRNGRWFALYVLLSLAIHWPLVGSITTHISYGHETEATVPLLNVWTVWWNANRAASGFRGYWNSPIFHPTKTTFVFSEAQPTSLIVAPIIWLTDNRCLAYNVYQLLILALNGFAAHCLLRRLGHVPWLAFCGGVMSQILPFVMWQSGVVQLTTLFGIYWTLHAVLDLFKTAWPEGPSADTKALTSGSGPEPGGESTLVNDGATTLNGCSSVSMNPETSSCRRGGIGLRLGLAFAATYLACNYWGLFLLMLLVPSSVCLWNRRMLGLAFWRDVAVAVAVMAVLIGPFAVLQRSLSRQHAWQTSRTEELILSLSAHPLDHTDVPWKTWTDWLEFPEADRKDAWGLGAGGLKLILSAVGVIAGCTVRRRRRWTLFALVFGLVAFGISLGPLIRFASGIPLIGQMCPYKLMQQYVPGFSLIRSPFRFALFVQLAIAWLSVEALDLLNPMRWNLGSGRFRLLCWIPLLIISTCVTLEAVPTRTNLYRVPGPNDLPVWVVWLRDSAEPSAPIACLPFPHGYQVGDYEATTLWMYWGTFHQHPLLNGYSGFFPQPYNDLRDALDQFQAPASLKANETWTPNFSNYTWDSPGLISLNRSDARYVVMRRDFGSPGDVGLHPQTRFRWALVVSDELEQIDIYELPRQDD